MSAAHQALLTAIHEASAASEQVYERDGADSHHLIGFRVPVDAWLALLAHATSVELGREEAA